MYLNNSKNLEDTFEKFSEKIQYFRKKFNIFGKNSIFSEKI